MITVGNPVPAATLKLLGTSGIENIALSDRLKGKKVVLFAVPGPYTPTCSQIHLPSFVKNADAIKAKGVSEIICVAVSDPFVMAAWGKEHQTTGKVTLLSDWDASFSKAMGLTLENKDAGLGVRALRYSAVIENGIVKHLDVEANPGQCEISSGDSILENL